MKNFFGVSSLSMIPQNHVHIKSNISYVGWNILFLTLLQRSQCPQSCVLANLWPKLIQKLPLQLLPSSRMSLGMISIPLINPTLLSGTKPNQPISRISYKWTSHLLNVPFHMLRRILNRSMGDIGGMGGGSTLWSWFMVTGVSSPTSLSMSIGISSPNV